MARPSARDSILDAAEAIVREVGAIKLTLDAAAERASMSKGGLLYHFPTKEALLEGMLSRLLERAQERRERIYEGLEDSPGRMLRAEILVATGKDEADKKVGSGLLAAVANDPSLMKAVQEFHRARFQRAKKTTFDFERAALLMLAADGLVLLELLHVSPFSAAQRQALIKALLAQVDDLEREQ